MVSVLYLAIFIVAAWLVFQDKDLAISRKPCEICLPRYWILGFLLLLFVGAEVFSILGTHQVWVISAVMVLSMSGFLFAAFFMLERKKLGLAALQICYVFLITAQFYAWW